MLHPRALHKILKQKCGAEQVVHINKLAEELKIEVADLIAALEILENLQVIRVSMDKNILRLTESGASSNIE